MRQRIRILYAVHQPTFTERLEQRAKQIAEHRRRDEWDISAVSILERQIGLALGQLDRVRELHQELRRSLSRVEDYTKTELRDVERRTPKYSPYRFPEREKLQRRLLRFEEERRRLALTQEEQLQRLQDRMLELLNHHRQLQL